MQDDATLLKGKIEELEEAVETLKARPSTEGRGRSRVGRDKHDYGGFEVSPSLDRGDDAAARAKAARKARETRERETRERETREREGRKRTTATGLSGYSTAVMSVAIDAKQKKNVDTDRNIQNPDKFTGAKDKYAQ